MELEMEFWIDNFSYCHNDWCDCGSFRLFAINFHYSKSDPHMPTVQCLKISSRFDVHVNQSKTFILVAVS